MFVWSPIKMLNTMKFRRWSKITAEMFFRILRENSEVALDVIRMLSDKLTRTHAQVEELQGRSQGALSGVTHTIATPDHRLTAAAVLARAGSARVLAAECDIHHHVSTKGNTGFDTTAEVAAIPTA